MLIKVVALLFVLGMAGRVLFPSRWKGLGVWFKRFIDLTLIALFLAFGIQLLMIMK